MLAAQAYYVYKKPQVSAAASFRLWLWMVYAAFMACSAVILIVCYAIVPVPSTSSISQLGWWAITWFPAVAFISIYANIHWHDALAVVPVPKPDAAAGPLAEGAEATLNSWVTNPIAALSGPVAEAVEDGTDDEAVMAAVPLPGAADADVEEGVPGACRSSNGTTSRHVSSNGSSGSSSHRAAGGDSGGSNVGVNVTRERRRHQWCERW
jgi:uncharacterized membrane protein YgcG